ncbi:hypothetical protein F5887DRAFT_881515, partial [Amanita rubescens]
KWTLPIYAFYLPIPEIGCDDRRPFHNFICANKGCTKRIWRYLDKRDTKSTGNLKKHAERCWKPEVVQETFDTNNLKETHEVIATVRDGTITSHFEHSGKGKETYCNRATIAKIVCWVAENNCPFVIVSDRGFRFLMKTGRPYYYIPSPWTVSRNVHLIFAQTRQCIAAMLMVSYWITTTS